MSFEKPPSLNDFDEIVPERRPELTAKQKSLRLLLLIFGVLVLVLGGLNLAKSDLTAALRGTGAVRGLALDAQGQPLVGEVFVTGTRLVAKTNPDGSFELKNVPAGQRSIVIADAVSGREFPILIQAGQTADLGTVQLKSTETP